MCLRIFNILLSIITISSVLLINNFSFEGIQRCSARSVALCRSRTLT